MTRTVRFAAALVLVLAAALRAPALRADDATFTRDVAPVLFEHCAECHRAGGIGPMALATYAEARPWAKAIRREVSARRMPPFGAAGGDFALRFVRGLSEREIAAIVRWADAGAPEGDPAQLPSPPDWAALEARAPRPDLVWAHPDSLTIPPRSDLQRAFVIENPLDRDLWVAGIEYEREGGRGVHHMFAFTDPSGLARRLEQEDEPPGFLGSVDGGEGTDTMMRLFEQGGGGFGGWAPGAGVVRYPRGTGQLLRRGTDIVLQYHYWNAGDAPIEHRPRIGLFEHQGPVERVLEFAGPSANDYLDIRAGLAGAEHHGDWTALEDLEIVGAMPHMHFLGSAMRLTLHHPGGGKQLLLDVPRFDFDWQIVYQFEQPVAISRGTRVHMVARHDNSAANPRQLFVPPRNVRFGERSDDEMADGILFIARRRGQGVADTPRLLGAAEADGYRAGAALSAIVPFAPYGPPGVGMRWQHELGSGHVYYQSADHPEVTAGVFLERPIDDVDFEPWRFSELVAVIDGELTLTDTQGRDEVFRSGELVLVPRGARVGWRHREPLRKYWLIFDHGEPVAGAPSFVRIDPRADVASAGGERVVYQRAGATVVVSRGPARDQPPAAAAHDQLVLVLGGHATLTQGDGVQGEVHPGQLFTVARATPLGWRHHADFERLVVRLEPRKGQPGRIPTSAER